VNVDLYSASTKKSVMRWYTGRWWVGCYIWYSEDWTRRSHSPPRPPPRCIKCNSLPVNGQCTNHRIAV